MERLRSKRYDSHEKQPDELLEELIVLLEKIDKKLDRLTAR